MKTQLTLLTLLTLATVALAVTPNQRRCWLMDHGVTNFTYGAIVDTNWTGNTTVLRWDIKGVPEPTTAQCRPVAEADRVWSNYLAAVRASRATVTNAPAKPST